MTQDTTTPTPLSARVDHLEANLARIERLEAEVLALRVDRDRWKTEARKWEGRRKADLAAGPRPGAFKPITTQDELDRIVKTRITRMRRSVTTETEARNG